MNMLSKILTGCLVVSALTTSVVFADQDGQLQISPAAGEQIDWQTVANGGGSAGNPYHIVTGTIGQAVVGQSEFGDYRISAGFWQDFELTSPTCCVGRIGDANASGDDMPTIGDISVMIDAKFITGACIESGTGANIRCLGEADANLSGGANPTCDDVSIGDISMLIDDLFITGEPPFVRNNCAQ